MVYNCKVFKQGGLLIFMQIMWLQKYMKNIWHSLFAIFSDTYSTVYLYLYANLSFHTKRWNLYFDIENYPYQRYGMSSFI